MLSKLTSSRSLKAIQRFQNFSSLSVVARPPGSSKNVASPKASASVGDKIRNDNSFFPTFTSSSYHQHRWMSSGDAHNSGLDAVMKRKAKRKSKATAAAWENYLKSTGTAADAHEIFRAIDLSSNGKISALELQLFVEESGVEGVSPQGLDLLKSLVEENEDGEHHHELDEQEFIQWLNIATDFSSVPVKDEPPASRVTASEAHEGVLKLRAKRKCKLMNTVWDKYLSGSGEMSVEDVFKVIDLNRNMKISVLELLLFFQSVEFKGVKNAQAIQELEKQDNMDAEMDFDEFQAWIQANCS
jgi:Ca2+-binding EF-hand superfamily protein